MSELVVLYLGVGIAIAFLSADPNNSRDSGLSDSLVFCAWMFFYPVLLIIAGIALIIKFIERHKQWKHIFTSGCLERF